MGQRFETVEKEMVGTWGLEPQTSTVSNLIYLIPSTT